MPSNRTHAPFEDDLVHVGRTVRMLRRRIAISQEELGYRSNLHRNYIGAIERGEINATFRTFLRVAQGLEVRLSMIVLDYERRRDDAV
jgi:transcriptional regulator with XRE-family HTH domain